MANDIWASKLIIIYLLSSQMQKNTLSDSHQPSTENLIVSWRDVHHMGMDYSNQLAKNLVKPIWSLRVHFEH